MSGPERGHVERVVRAREAARRATGTWAAKRELAEASPVFIAVGGETFAAFERARCEWLARG
jgi:hypothetical protein